MTFSIQIPSPLSHTPRLWFGALLLAWALPTAALAEETITTARPVAPQPSPGEVQPGLAVTYYYAMFEHIRDIPHLVRGTPGEPIPLLDHDTDSGPVLTAKRSMGVGAQIRGVIRFPEAGSYRFQVKSNDGVQVNLGEALLHEDPWVHPDTLSDPIVLVAEQAGWYSLAIDYYQKKGTSALVLYWTRPGSDQKEVVPAELLGHLE